MRPGRNIPRIPMIVVVTLTAIFFVALAIPAEAAVPTDSLVGYWKFDDGSGTSATDSSGHGNTGTLTNGPTWSASPTNDISFTNPYALEFDGANDYVDGGTIVADIAGASAFTFSTWFQQDVIDQFDGLFALNIDGSSDLRIYTYSDGSLYLEFGDGSGQYGLVNDYSPYVSAGSWHQLTVVFDGAASGNSNRLKLFINGSQVTIDTFSGTIGATLPAFTTQTAHIGNYDNKARAFDGLLDDVRIYNRALTTTEITALANGTHTSATWDGSSSTDWETAANWDINAVPDPYTNITIADTSNDPVVSCSEASCSDSLVGYWKLDEGAGTTAADSSGNSNTGTLTGGPTWSASPTNDISFTNPYALEFDGQDDYVATSTDVSLTAGLSYSVWVKTTSSDSTAAYTGNAAQNVLGDYKGSVYNGFGVHGGVVRYNHYASGWIASDGSTSVNDDVWHHIAATHRLSDGSVVVYVDGTEDGSGTATYGTTFTKINRIGGGYGVGDLFTGLIDDVRIYDRALSVPEVRAWTILKSSLA